MWSRRSFLTAIGLAGGAAALPGSQDGPSERIDSERRRQRSVPIRGERYAGFVLLPQGAPLPFDVQEPRRETPIFCGVGAGRGGPEVTAIHTAVASEVELAHEVYFPVYLVGAEAAGLVPAGGDVLRYDNGDVFAASLDYQSRGALSGQIETTVALWAYVDFPRPYPLWETSPAEPDGPYIEIEKVDFLPTPGVMVRSARGYVFHWIQDDVLYTLTAENDPTFEEARALVGSLIELPGRAPRRPLEN